MRAVESGRLRGDLLHRLRVFPIEIPALPADEWACAPVDRSMELRVGMSLGEADRRLILSSLAQCSGDRKDTAKLLGVCAKTLCKRIRQYGSSGAAQA